MKKLTTRLTLILLFVLAIGSLAPWGPIGSSWLTSIVVLLALVLGGMAGWSRGPKEVLALGGAASLSILLVHADWGNGMDFFSNAPFVGERLGAFLYGLMSAMVAVAFVALVTRFMLADALKSEDNSRPT